MYPKLNPYKGTGSRRGDIVPPKKLQPRIVVLDTWFVAREQRNVVAVVAVVGNGQHTTPHHS